MEFADPVLMAELGAVAAAAGFVDTLAGGGSLITLPTLLLAQVPPLHALAINKLQSTCGSGTATVMMLRHRLVALAGNRGKFAAALAGSICGTLLVQRLHAGVLDTIIPIVLVVICGYVLFSPKVGEIARVARMSEPLYRAAVVPLIGLYDGSFGPGTGSFFAMSAVALRGRTLLEATAQAKLLNFATNLASAVVFTASGRVLWPLALSMGVGQMIGATLGGRVLARGHTALIRPLIVTASLGMIGRYLWQHFAAR